MTTVEQLQALVDEAYDARGLPSWADPHPLRESPRDEEYSRVTDPERYRIVHERARLWADVLVERLGVRAQPVAPVPPEPGRKGVDRGVRLVPGVSGALPLLLLERDVPQPGMAPLAVLDIAVVRTDVLVDGVPDCGCDACDSGSADLLHCIDVAVRRVVGGTYVLLRADGWRAAWYPDGGEAGGQRHVLDFRVAMDLCRALAAGEDVPLPRGVEAFVALPWTNPEPADDGRS